MSKQNTVRSMVRKSLFAVSVEVDGEEAIAFTDQMGYFIDENEVKEILGAAEKFYRADNINDFIKEQNVQQHIYSVLSDDYRAGKTENGKTILKWNAPEERYFDSEKRHYSFRCSLCNEKVSSKDRTNYFVQNTKVDNFRSSPRQSFMVCSEACGRVIAKEEIRNWIKEEGFEDYLTVEE